MKRKILTQSQVREAIDKIARTILKRATESRSTWALVGVHRRGVPLARRLAQLLQDGGAPTLPVGTLDITFYRDDRDSTPLQPIVHDTDIPFDINGKTIFLVDDVLFTGRTVRCALDELMDFGRPDRVYLVALLDRGFRELPVQPDFVGSTVSALRSERVEVHMEETDGEDAVWVVDEKGRLGPGKKK